MKDNETLKALVAEWRKSTASENKSDFKCAQLCAKSLAATGSPKDLAFFLGNRLNQSPSQTGKHIKMAFAYASCSRPGLWALVGWDGIVALSKIVGPKDLELAYAEIARSGVRNGTVGTRTVEKIVKNYLPKKPEVSNEDRVKKIHPAHERDVLVVELRKLMKKFPTAIKFMSPEAKKILGIDQDLAATG